MAPKPGPPASDFWRRRRARIPNTLGFPPGRRHRRIGGQGQGCRWARAPAGSGFGRSPRIASRVELFVRPRLDQRGARFQACIGAQSELCPRAPRVCYCARNARQVRCCYRAHPCRAGLGSPLFRDRQRSLIRLGMRRPLRRIDRFRAADAAQRPHVRVRPHSTGGRSKRFSPMNPSVRDSASPKMVYET